MITTKRILLLGLILALSLPASALAQSAGDEQYVDPFQGSGDAQGGGGSSGSQGGGGGSQGGQGSGQSAPAAPAPPAAAAPTTPATPDTAVTPAPTASQGATLPRTGLPLVGLVLTGVALLSGGVTLRRRC